MKWITPNCREKKMGQVKVFSEIEGRKGMKKHNNFFN